MLVTVHIGGKNLNYLTKETEKIDRSLFDFLGQQHMLFFSVSTLYKLNLDKSSNSQRAMIHYYTEKQIRWVLGDNFGIIFHISP